MMKKFLKLTLLIAVALSMTGCALIGDIFYVQESPKPQVEKTQTPVLRTIEPTPTFQYDRAMLIDTSAVIKAAENTANGIKNDFDRSYYSFILNREFLKGLNEQNSTLGLLATDIYAACMNFQTEYSVPDDIDVNVDQLRTCMYAIFNECPELMQLKQSYKYWTYEGDDRIVKIALEFSMDEETFLTALNRTYNVISAWNNETNGMTLYDREFYVYNKIIEKVVYDLDADYCDTAYGAVVLGRALCEGYSNAFMLAMHYMGIPCAQLGGDAYDIDSGKQEAHAWNIVKLGDKWYHVDATWDDYDEERNLGSLYAYFNIKDDEIFRHRTLHEYYDNFVIPKCNSNDMSYYEINGYTVRNNTDLRSMFHAKMNTLAMQVDVSAGKNKTRLFLKFESERDYNTMKDNFRNWVNEWNKDQAQVTVSQYTYSNSSTMWVMFVQFEYERVPIRGNVNLG